jgi:transcriptional regulator with XRE-family HTH domain
MRKYPARRRAVISVLRDARIEAGLSQRELSVKLGEVINYIYMIEAGRRGVQVDEFIAIAQSIGADPVVLVKRVLRRP